MERTKQEKTPSGEGWGKKYALEEIEHSIETKRKLARACLKDIVQIADVITTALRQDRKVAFFGNGGSAADAQHLAAELVGRFAAVRSPLRALALTTDTSVITAVGNDFGFDDVFSRQVAAHIDKGDVVVGISTSGLSRNVIKGIQEARKMGARTIALTGASGGMLAKLCDYHVMAPSTNTQRIQECHILIGHILCGLIEAGLEPLPGTNR